MNQAYLQVTYRRGQPIAAYYYLPRPAGAKSLKTRRAAAGLLVDFTDDGKAIGIEITAPGRVTVAAINAVLEELGEKAIAAEELAPLHAA